MLSTSRWDSVLDRASRSTLNRCFTDNSIVAAICAKTTVMHRSSSSPDPYFITRQGVTSQVALHEVVYGLHGSSSPTHGSSSPSAPTPSFRVVARRLNVDTARPSHLRSPPAPLRSPPSQETRYASSHLRAHTRTRTTAETTPPAANTGANVERDYRLRTRTQRPNRHLQTRARTSNAITVAPGAGPLRFKPPRVEVSCAS